MLRGGACTTPRRASAGSAESVRALVGDDDEVLLIPLVGHTRGHAAIAVKADDGWLLHAGDSYFFHREIEPGDCPPGLAFFQKMMAVDEGARVKNQQRLRALAADGSARGVRIFCSHSPVELERAREVSRARASALASS